MITSAPTTYNLTGDKDVTIINDADNFGATVTVNDNLTAGNTTVLLNDGVSAQADMSKVSYYY